MVRLALALVLALFAAAATAQLCLQPGAVPSPLPFDYDPSYGLCRRGFYCPKAVLSNRSTWPVVCPPTAACVQDRTDGELCPAQGVYEPILCPSGHYCPLGNLSIECPSGSWCPYGATEPKSCSFLSYCPKGSRTERFFGSILVVGLINIAAIVSWVVYRWWRQQIATAVEGPRGEEAGPELVEGLRRAVGEATGVRFSFRDLHVTVPGESRGDEPKVLLAGVSGQLRAGHVTAVLGPSGCGKTTFLRSLMDKLPGNSTMTGSLLINGRDTRSENIIPALKPMVGYVPQDDVLHTTLTVQENLQFAADVRLPSDWTAEERTAHVAAVMRALRIAHVADVHIGDAERRGVSGGQRKRASIGVELAAAPVALFLDDPTTGLDATTAMEVCRILKTLAAEANIPVCMSVTQPRVEIWEELDEVLLLAPGGRTVFQGLRSEAMGYFEEKAGVDFAKGNPCDNIVDAVHDEGDMLSEAWNQHVRELDPTLGTPMSPGLTSLPEPRPQANFLAQLWLNLQRASKKLHAHGSELGFDVGVAIVSTVMLTTAAINSPYEGIFRDAYVLLSSKPLIFVPGMLGMLWFIGLAGAVAPSSVRSFANDRMQYWREAASGYSRLSYFIGTCLVQQARLVLVTMNFALVAYLMWRPYMHFFSLWGVMYLATLSSDALSIIIGVLLPLDAAVLLSTVSLIFVALLNGFPQVPLITPVSYSLWATEALYTLDFLPVRDIYSETDIEDALGNYYTFFRLGLDFAVVIAMAVVWRLAALAALLLWKRDNQR